MNIRDKYPDSKKSVKYLNYKIIVVEDDDGLNRLIQKKLQKEGYETEGALTGQEALAEISGEKNEILLIDYKLPDMTGKQLTQKLIEKFDKVPPIIVVTGFGDEKIAVEMMKLGVWDYMVKEPNFIDILPEKIKHICLDIEKNKKLDKAEDDLRKSVELLNDTGDMARVGGWEVDLDKNTVYWTQSTKNIHEVAENYVPALEEAINFFPGESKTRMEKALEKAIQEGTGYDMELQIITAKNNKLWVQAIGKPEMKDGKCVRLHGTFQDITPRIEAERELKKRHEILKRTEKIAHVGSWEWDVATDTVTWSEELFRIFKVNPENGAVSYADHPKIYTPESMKKLDASVQKCLETGESYQLDLEIIRGDGSTAYCTVRGYGKTNKNGKVEKLHGSFQDITDRKEAEEELQKSKERLSNVIDNSPFPVAVVDEQDQNILYWSKSALQLFGHDPKTVEEWYELAYPDPKYRKEVIERWKPFLETAQNSAQAVNTGEYKIVCKNGSVKICEIYAQFMPGSLVITLNDITKSKKSEEQLKALNQQLQANEQQLRAANQQLQANEQQLRAANQQLQANEQELQAANQQLKASEQRMRASGVRLRLALESAEEGMWEWDLIDQQVFFDKGAKKMLGYNEEEFDTDAEIVLGLIHPDDKENSLVVVDEYINGKRKSYDVEFRLRCKDGSYKWVWSVGKIIRWNDKGEPALFTGVHRDITERKKAEELLKKNSLIIDSTTDIVLTTDLEGTITYANKAVKAIYGYKPEELVGKPVSILWKKENISYLQNSINNLIDGQVIQNLEIICLDKQGNEIPVLISLTGIKDSEGKVVELLGISKEIKTLKDIQNKLLKSEEKYKAMYNNALVGLFRVDIEQGNAIEANQASVELFGYTSVEEFIKEFRLINHYANPEDSEAMLKSLKENGYIDSIVIHIKKKDGTDIWNEASFSLDAEHKVIECLAIDVTERKKNEEGLLAEKLFSDSLISNLPGVFYLISEDRKFMRWNTHFEKVTGRSAEEMATISPMDLFEGEDKQRIATAIKQVFSLGKVQVMASFEANNGKKIHYQFNGHKIIVDGAACLIGLGLDYTEKKQTEIELVKAKEKAEESDRLKSAFLANMSHEIRTPMNGILGFSNLLKEPKLSGEQQQKYIGIIEKSGERMLNIINDIVDISKIEAGLMKLDITESDINEQIEYIYTFFKPEVDAKGMKLSFKNPLPAKEAIIKTDREKVFAILTNLVKNAIKYTNKGSIEFGYNKKGNFIEFFVEDTGIGIPKERQQAIFERFIQADIEDVQARQGAGLGLAITKAYVEMLGGKIWVESEQGRGSTFYFTIPYNTAFKTDTSIDAIDTGEDALNLDLKILIVEDDKTSSDLLSIIVGKYEKETISVANGIKALEACHSHPDIDLILMDIQLPGINGYEVTRQIRAFNKEVIIIAQTAYGLSGDREKAIEAGCNNYISKPVKKEKLDALIRKYFKQ